MKGLELIPTVQFVQEKQETLMKVKEVWSALLSSSLFGDVTL